MSPTASAACWHSMRSCLPDAWTVRAQPWLGTLVEIALPRADATDVRFAAAFARVAHVHRRMSAQNPESDLARIARDAHRRAVRVDPDTHAVLAQAMLLARETAGLFDVTVGSVLARHGQLPLYGDTGGPGCGAMDAVHLESDGCVRTSAPITLDLGGIAKGYAVDCAVNTLRDAGASAGTVNAGGDLRAFGPETWQPIRIRHPGSPNLSLHLFDICDAAVATSADYFRRGQHDLVDPRSGAVRAYGDSVSVVAPDCTVADALTKIVALDPARAVVVLARYGAVAFRLGADAVGAHCSATFAAPSPRLRLPLRRAA